MIAVVVGSGELKVLEYSGWARVLGAGGCHDRMDEGTG